MTFPLPSIDTSRRSAEPTPSRTTPAGPARSASRAWPLLVVVFHALSVAPSSAQPAGAGAPPPGAPPPAAASSGGSSVEITESGAIKGRENAIAPPTLALLESMAAAHGAARTVRGEFTQTKTSEIFLEKFESKGRFRFQKPDRFRCDYDPPDASTNLIVDDAIYVHFPSIQQVERYRFKSREERDQQLHVMLLGFNVDVKTIAREYDMVSSEEAGSPALEELNAAGGDPAKTALLIARPSAEFEATSPFVLLKLWIDKGTKRPVRIWYQDYNDEKTELAIHEVKFDEPIDESHFRPNFPPGTEFIDKSDMRE